MRIKNDDVLAHLRSFGFTMQDILAYTELICSLQDAGLTGMSQDCTCYQEEDVVEPMDNPLISFPRKPEGFMAQ